MFYDSYIHTQTNIIANNYQLIYQRSQQTNNKTNLLVFFWATLFSYISIIRKYLHLTIHPDILPTLISTYDILPEFLVATSEEILKYFKVTFLFRGLDNSGLLQ
jgi:hypothetical protein